MISNTCRLCGKLYVITAAGSMYRHFIRLDNKSLCYDCAWRPQTPCEGDWKSGKGIFADALLQTAAYVLLYNEHNPEAPITGGIDIVRFSKDAAISDHRRIRDKKLIELAQRQFLRLREAYEDDKSIQELF